MVVRNILVDRVSQVALAEWNQSMQAFELDGPHEPFCMRVTVRSTDGHLDNVDSGTAQERERWAAPFSIAIANQHRARVQNAVDVVGEMPQGLQHEGFVWMRRGTNDVHPPGLKLDDKQGVVRDEPTHGPHLSSKKSAARSAGQCARKNDYHDVDRSGVGGRPAFFRIFATVVRATR